MTSAINRVSHALMNEGRAPPVDDATKAATASRSGRSRATAPAASPAFVPASALAMAACESSFNLCEVSGRPNPFNRPGRRSWTTRSGVRKAWSEALKVVSAPFTDATKGLSSRNTIDRSNATRT